MLGLPGTFWALLLKPLLAIPILAAMFFLPRYIARALRPFIPKRWQGLLFEGWQHDKPKRRDYSSSAPATRGSTSPADDSDRWT